MLLGTGESDKRGMQTEENSHCKSTQSETQKMLLCCSFGFFPALALTQWPLGRRRDCWCLPLLCLVSLCSSFTVLLCLISFPLQFNLISELWLGEDRDHYRWERRRADGDGDGVYTPIAEEESAEKAEETNFNLIWYQILLYTQRPRLSMKVNRRQIRTAGVALQCGGLSNFHAAWYANMFWTLDSSSPPISRLITLPVCQVVCGVLPKYSRS